MYTIKCKAWHENLNKMFSAEELGKDELTLSPDGRGFVNVNAVSPQLSEYYPFMIPILYTNNNAQREVYHKDILGFKFRFGTVYGIVEFVEDGWAVVNKTGEYIVGLWECIQNCEAQIEGNVYEHPELMKEQTNSTTGM